MAAMPADLLFYGGPIWGAEGADAVAVQGGRIAAVGPAAEVFRLRGPETRLVALNGRALLPAFFDAHVHFLRLGLDRTFYVDLSAARSLAEALDLLRQAARTRPGTWVVGRGWDESRWPERRYLERDDLDRAVPQQPCCAVRVDGHLVACNTLALARCTRPEGEFVDRDLGHLREDAAWELLSTVKPDEEMLLEGVAEASRLAASHGVAAVADMASRDLPLYLRAARRGALKTRVFLYLPTEHLEAWVSLGLRRGFGTSLVRVQGIKVFMDGSIGARTAAVQEPYRQGGHGQLLMNRAELARLWRRMAEAEAQAAIHAIGDQAIEEVLAAARQAGLSPHERHRIEHLELPTPKQLEAMAALGLVASMQPNFVANWSGPGKMYEDRLGPERDARIDPHTWVLDHGIPLAFGSDGMPFGPLVGLQAAVDAPHPPQRLSVEDAVRAYTEGAAFSVFAEGELGRIAPHFWADLVILSRDPRTAAWQQIRVEATYVAGELVYSG